MGILRDRIFAHNFGASDVLDTYYAAFHIPDLIYNLLIVGAIAAGFIPVFTELLVKNKEEAWKVASGIITILGTVLLAASAIIFVFAPDIIKILVPGFNPEKIEQTATLTRIMLASPFLLGVSSILGSMLQSFKSFLVYSITPIMYNLGIIFGATMLVPHFGANGLAYGVVIGAVLHLIIQIPALLHYNFRFRPTFNWKNTHVRKIIYLVVPRTLGLAASQINLVVTTMIASTIGSGSISVFNFANNLQYFPIGIVGVSFAVAAFPTLSSLKAQGKDQELKNTFASTTKQILFLIIPFTILFIMLRAQIVRVLLGTGAFDWEATILTANTLAFFSFSLFAQSLVLLVVRIFYVYHDTITPFLVSILAAMINIGASILLKSHYGVIGLAMGYSIAAIAQFSILWLLLRYKIGSLQELSILTMLYKISIAVSVMAVVVQSLKKPLSLMVDMTRFWGIFTQGVVVATVGFIVYGLVCRLLNVEEMSDLWKVVKRKISSTK